MWNGSRLFDTMEAWLQAKQDADAVRAELPLRNYFIVRVAQKKTCIKEYLIWRIQRCETYLCQNYCVEEIYHGGGWSGKDSWWMKILGLAQYFGIRLGYIKLSIVVRVYDDGGLVHQIDNHWKQISIGSRAPCSQIKKFRHNRIDMKGDWPILRNNFLYVYEHIF